jgi:Ca2+-binding EF-hand superfamily protein
MCKTDLLRTALTIASAFLVFASLSFGQMPPNQVITGQNQKLKQQPDEFKNLLSAVEEAYKAPREVDKDVLDEIRKQYKSPSPEREAKIFREIRRLYALTSERELAIAVELRQAYEKKTPEQEDRVFREIRRGGQLPLGAIPLQTQTELAARLFAKFDQDGNKSLSNDEMSDTLRAQLRTWDSNQDGVLDMEEFGAYYRVGLKAVSAKVASGEIVLRAAPPSSVPSDNVVAPPPARVDDARPMIARVGRLPQGLPDWFAKYDTDGDGQVGLYEWVKAGRPVVEFQAMDRNGDGLLEAAELLRYLAEPARKADGTVAK